MADWHMRSALDRLALSVPDEWGSGGAPWTGLAAALLPVLFVEALRNLGLLVPGPEPLFVLGIVFAAFLGGTTAGLFGSLLIVLYGAFFFYKVSEPEVFYTARAGARLMILMVTAPSTAIIVGLLRARTRQRVDDQLRVARHYSLTLLESMQDGLVAFNATGQVFEVNRSFCAMTGLDRTELIGRTPPLPYWPPEHAASLRQVFDRYAGGYRGEYDLIFQRKNGERFAVTVAGSPIEEEGNGFVMRVTDDTQRRLWQQRLEEALRQLRVEAAQRARDAQALQRSNQALDQFAYAASHDLKAPLRGIANLSQWIEEDMGERLTPEAQRQMALLRGRVHRMELLIDGILQYSRIGRTDTNLQWVDVSELLDEVVELQGLADRDIVRRIGDWPRVKAHRPQLQQVFMNLLGNAVKHHPHDSADPVQVVVQCRRSGDFYEFSVSDNGPGIDPKYHEVIFQMFQTLQPRDMKEGAGIGLALVKKIIQTHGGTIWVESEPGRGSTFRFTWPCDATPVESQATRPSSPPLPGAARPEDRKSMAATSGD